MKKKKKPRKGKVEGGSAQGGRVKSDKKKQNKRAAKTFTKPRPSREGGKLKKKISGGGKKSGFGGGGWKENTEKPIGDEPAYGRGPFAWQTIHEKKAPRSIGRK